MKVYSAVGSYDGEAFTSVHMTRKGALICALQDIYEYFDVVFDTISTEFVDDNGNPCFIGDSDELKTKSSDDLYRIFRSWCDVLWERSNAEYRIDIVQTSLRG